MRALFASGGPLSLFAQRKRRKKSAPAGGSRHRDWWKSLAMAIQSSRGVHEGYTGPSHKAQACFKRRCQEGARPEKQVRNNQGKKHNTKPWNTRPCNVRFRAQRSGGRCVAEGGGRVCEGAADSRGRGVGGHAGTRVVGRPDLHHTFVPPPTIWGPGQPVAAL